MTTKQTVDIQTLSSRTVYENRWMRVREDAVRFLNGDKGIYGVVEKPDFVVIIPRDADGRIHLVQQFRYPVSARYWELPQGSWETEPSAGPVSIALGELAEETGLRARTITKVCHLFEAYGYSNQGFHIFLATILQQGDPDREIEEQGMISRAFTLDEVVDLIRCGEIKDAATVAALGFLRMTGQL